MSFLFRPAARILRDGTSLSGPEAGLVRLDIACGLGEIGEATLSLWLGSRLADLAPGARLAIALGPAGDETAVFTGLVAHVARAPSVVTVLAREPTAALQAHFVSRAYLNQSAATVARDLAAPVETETIEAELDLAQYGVENRRDAWWHLRDIACLAGCDLMASPAGKLLLRPAGRGATHTLRHGADVLAFETAEQAAPQTLAYAAHGGASSAGSDRWHWIVPDPLGARPGPARVLAPLAADDAAAAAGKARAARGQAQAKFGWASLHGRAAIRPGDGIDLREAASGGLLTAAAGRLEALAGGTSQPPWRAIRVRHRFDSAQGFVTDISLEGTPSAAAGVNPLAALS